MFNKNFSHELNKIVDLFLELQQVKKRRRTCRDLKIAPEKKRKIKKNCACVIYPNCIAATLLNTFPKYWYIYVTRSTFPLSCAAARPRYTVVLPRTA